MGTVLMRVNLPVSNIEHPVPEGEVLISKANLQGIITYCNRAFCEVTGYTDMELLGAPHNIIRHPDVPAEVFADFWQSIQSGKPWNGVIKNRCKNGDHYWMEANVTPWLEHGEAAGYVSLRYKATAAQIAAAEEFYRAVRDQSSAVEQSHKSDLHYIVELQQRLAEKIMAQEKYYDGSEEQLRIGSDIMARITDAYSIPDPDVRLKISPATHYSGDIILVSRTPAGNLHIMLADAVGHGLIAAMNLLPLSQIFNTMAMKGFTVSRIAAELNSKIHRLMPVDRFIGAILISIDFREQVIETWNGGIPEPLLVSMDGTILHKWRSRNLPLGILNDKVFSSEVEVFHYDDDCQLFLFSDGLPEAESPEGEQFGRERIEQLIQSAESACRFDALTNSLGNHLGSNTAHDDVSLAMISIALAEGQEILTHHLSLPDNEAARSHWRIALSLGEDELKYLDAVPLLTQIVSKIHATAEHHSALYVILSELFNNALEHGILRLDSAIKQGADGFDKYLHLREARLRSLVGGSIDIEIEKVMIAGCYGVKIRVVDSGDGFDYSAIQTDAMKQVEQMQHGRGIALARSLACKLEFAQRGNEVIAYYVCS